MSTLHSPATILSELLIGLGLAVDGENEWAVKVNEMPDTPDNCIVCVDQVGIQDGRYMRDGQRVTHPGIQIGIRGTEFRVGFEHAQLVALALDSVRNMIVTVDSSSYLIVNISRTTDVVPLNVEERNQRQEFSVNALITLGPT